MPNSEQYHFSDFTRDNYRRLLKMAKSKYKFCSFHNWEQSSPSVIWRHDCDTSIHAARSLARIEADEGISATYFVLLNNEFYNLLEREVRDATRDILNLGHELGLHFDAHYHDIQNVADLEKWLLFEKNILEQVFNCKIRTFSFHIPTPATEVLDKDSYGGMLNIYSEKLRKGLSYCSDSNGYWRHRRLEDVLKTETSPHLQVLTHPEYWQDKVMSPKERIARCVQGRAEKTLVNFEKLVHSHGRPLLDWSDSERCK